MVKNLPSMWETWVRSLVWEDPLEKGMATHSSIWARRIPPGQRSLVGYSPWGCKELDTTERLSLSLFLLGVLVLTFIFRSLIYFELIFAYDVR